MKENAPQALDILLVDDSEDDILLMREALASERVLNIVHSAQSGQQALDYLRQGEVALPALVLLDINMPGMTGFEVLDEMKAEPELASIPVVMLTTSRNEMDVVRSYSGGACSFITKPIDLSQLQTVAHTFSLYWTLVARTPDPRSSRGGP